MCNYFIAQLAGRSCSEGWRKTESQFETYFVHTTIILLRMFATSTTEQVVFGFPNNTPLSPRTYTCVNAQQASIWFVKNSDFVIWCFCFIKWKWGYLRENSSVLSPPLHGEKGDTPPFEPCGRYRSCTNISAQPLFYCACARVSHLANLIGLAQHFSFCPRLL